MMILSVFVCESPKPTTTFAFTWSFMTSLQLVGQFWRQIKLVPEKNSSQGVRPRVALVYPLGKLRSDTLSHTLQVKYITGSVIR